MSDELEINNQPSRPRNHVRSSQNDETSSSSSNESINSERNQSVGVYHISFNNQSIATNSNIQSPLGLAVFIPTNSNVYTTPEMQTQMENIERQRRQQRVQMALSTTMFFFVLLVLMDDRRSQNHGYKPNGESLFFPNIVTKPIPSIVAEEQLSQRKHLSDLLNDEAKASFTATNYSKILSNQSDFKPLNVSGIYSGEWNEITKLIYDILLGERNKNILVKPTLDDYNPGRSHKNPSIGSVPKGSLWLFLQMKPVSEASLASDVAYVTGQIVLHAQSSAFSSTLFSVEGVFLRKSGRLTLYGNRPDSLVQLEYPALPLNETHSEMNRTTNETISNSTQKVYPSTIKYNVSPLKLRPPSRFRHSDAILDLCFYEINMDVDKNDIFLYNNDTTSDHNLNFSGILTSPNCDIFMAVQAKYEDVNLGRFYGRANRFAFLMTIICLIEIYLIMKQLKYSDTPATAAKVSLLTIGYQAFLDSYLCLLHITIGIVAQKTFSAFACVAICKLIMFSVFEMRYLLLIWKARRPQHFQEGWMIARREITVLYSRFYFSLLVGIVIIYHYWNYLDFLMFIAYSFWIPQIIHNAHRSLKDPFDLSYLFGISFTRLILPMYMYSCPENYLSAFPFYHYHPNPWVGYYLAVWVGLQVSILLLQSRFGPRFFVPAMFLPIQYNYERRLDAQQLSLLHSYDTDSIDCVICMLELDVEARDYMIAPCDHIFHRQCLNNWMAVKMECPTCRYVLPQP